MTKPTFMQSLLNKPSQSYSYSHPVKQNYHSTKQDMLRVANSIDRPAQQLRALHRRGLSYEDLEPSEDSDLEDLFFTPNTSPRTSMASSIAFPTGRKPSRRSLKLSDASDTSPRPITPATTTTTAARAPTSSAVTTASTAVVSTRTPSTTAAFSSTQSRNQRTAHTLSTTSSLSTTSLQPHSVISDYLAPTRQPDLDDKRKAKEGTTTKRTRHGSVTLIPSTTTQPQSVKSTTTSNQKTGQQDTWDVKRPPPTSSSNGSAITPAPAKASVNTSIGTPQVLASRRSSKTQTHVNPVTAASSKEKPKQETEVPSTYKTKEKEKELDSSPLSRSRTKDKGKEKAKPIPVPIPKTTYSSPAPHTFSAFAPLAPSSSTLSSASPTNGSTSSTNKPSLLPPGFSFPPPPHHSPQQQQPQPKNSVNGSTAAYTYAQRQKGSSSPKPAGSSAHNNSIMMNMAVLLEEDELDADGTPTRKLRRIANGSGSGQNKGKEKRRESYDSRSSRSGSSHHSYSGSSPSRSNSNSHPTSNFKSHRTSHSQSHSDASTIRSPPKTLSSEVNAMSLPTPGELPSIGTQGYTSLVLPRAPMPLGPHSTSTRSASTGSQRKWFGSVGKEGRIDLTRNGVAQTTMTSVEVVRGLGKQQGQNGLGGKFLGMFGRRRSISSGGTGPRPIEGLSRAASDAGTISEDLSFKRNVPTTAGVEGTVLGFTSYRKPPSYVPSSSVVVQVWAVGVDGLDGRLVGVKFGDHISSEGAYEEEAGVETEWEREREARRDEEVDVTRSTPQRNSNGGLSLGRSFSLRKPRMGAAGMDAKRQEDNQPTRGRTQLGQQEKPSRSFSLKRNNTGHSSQSKRPSNTLTKSASQKQAQRQKMLQRTHRAEVGYIPGRSFVGRVLDCGWDVRDEVAKKGDWVVGLLDVKRCGALTEFIVVDRHRIHRVPHPRKVPQQNNGDSTEAEAFQDNDSNMSALTLEELALLPLCGIPAYRAVRTFIYTFSSLEDGGMASPIIVNDRKGIEFGSTTNSKTTEHPQDRRRRVLVLRGHEGVGAMAVQMLARRGWKVSVHVPFSSSSTSEPVPSPPTTSSSLAAATAEHDSFSKTIQDQARDWGADEIIFDEEAGEGVDDGRIAAIRVIESLREDGDVFDAILDTVGGKEVREAGERLLRSAGALPPTPGVNGGFVGGNEPMSPRGGANKPKGVGQFTTLVGDVPERPIPTAGDNFRAGLRSWRFDSAGNGGNGDEGTTAAADMKGNRIEYAWVSVAQDVDWEGEDIADTLAVVLRLSLENGVKPVIAANHRVVPFEKAPYVFVDKGPLGHGCNVVVKIVG